MRLIHDHIYKYLGIIGRCIAAEGYDIVFLVTPYLLSSSCFTCDFIAFHPGGRAGTALGVYRLIESLVNKLCGGFRNSLTDQYRIHLFHNRSLFI